MTSSFISIEINRDSETTLKQLAKVSNAIEKQFALFLSAKYPKAKGNKVYLEQFNFNGNLQVKLFCEQEKDLLNTDIHREFVSYCNEIVGVVLNKEPQSTDAENETISTKPQIIPAELDNFSKIVEFAKEEHQIITSHYVKHESGKEERMLETVIDTVKYDEEEDEYSDGEERGISCEKVRGVSSARKRDLIVEMKNQEVVFGWKSCTFGHCSAKIQIEHSYIGRYQLKTTEANTMLDSHIAKELLRFNKKQSIEWQACKPKVVADITLAASNIKDESLYHIESFKIVSVTLQDRGDNDIRLFSNEKEEAENQPQDDISSIIKPLTSGEVESITIAAEGEEITVREEDINTINFDSSYEG